MPQKIVAQALLFIDTRFIAAAGYSHPVLQWHLYNLLF